MNPTKTYLTVYLCQVKEKWKLALCLMNVGLFLWQDNVENTKYIFHAL